MCGCSRAGEPIPWSTNHQLARLIAREYGPLRVLARRRVVRCIDSRRAWGVEGFIVVVSPHDPRHEHSYEGREQPVEVSNFRPTWG